jgi:hypothetical protein
MASKFSFSGQREFGRAQTCTLPTWRLGKTTIEMLSKLHEGFQKFHKYCTK